MVPRIVVGLERGTCAWGLLSPAWRRVLEEAAARN